MTGVKRYITNFGRFHELFNVVNSKYIFELLITTWKKRISFSLSSWHWLP